MDSGADQDQAHPRPLQRRRAAFVLHIVVGQPGKSCGLHITAEVLSVPDAEVQQLLLPPQNTYAPGNRGTQCLNKIDLDPSTSQLQVVNLLVTTQP